MIHFSLRLFGAGRALAVHGQSSLAGAEMGQRGCPQGEKLTRGLEDKEPCARERRLIEAY